MSCAARLAETLSRRLPVMLHLDGYMNRWWLLPRSLLKVGAEGHLVPRRFVPDIRLQQILRSDNDRHCHDHPRASLAIILATGYTEITPDRQAVKSPGSVTYRSATHLHRLVLPAGKSSWSIFTMFGPKREWGYATEHGWVHNRDYRAYRNRPAARATPSPVPNDSLIVEIRENMK